MRKPELKQEQVFDVLSSAYRSGALDKALSMVGEALESSGNSAGIRDVAARVEGTSPALLRKVDMLLGWSAPLWRVFGTDRVMSAVSRLLDLPVVKRAVNRGILKAMEG